MREIAKHPVKPDNINSHNSSDEVERTAQEKKVYDFSGILWKEITRINFLKFRFFELMMGPISNITTRNIMLRCISVRKIKIKDILLCYSFRLLLVSC